jgi:hypothetical protein
VIVESPFKVGDRVAFARRAQSSMGGMVVQEVNANMFDVLLKVDDKWWHPASFIPFEQWKRECTSPT